jgi:hypothetical protein
MFFVRKAPDAPRNKGAVMHAIDIMINRATFELVAAKRQKHVAALRMVDAAEDACTCARRCAPDCAARAARKIADDAAVELDAALTAWRAWHAGR